MQRAGIRLIACRHRHEYRVLQHQGVVMVWAPTTSVLREETPPIASNGAAAGMIEYVITGDTLMHRVIDLDTCAVPS